jgi:alpha,alpha-trehalase
MEIWYRELGEVDQAAYYCGEAVTLYAAIQKTLWNKDTGLFCNFNRRENRLSDFRFLTCVYPLWAGIASPQQAEQFRDNLPLFETAFGIKNTPHQTGCQWDSPFMWAPLVYFTVEGLRNYGFNDEAKRIAGKFTATTKRVYERTGANFEKYNADTGDCHVDGIIDVGYSENVVGFGWTNGVAALYLDERMT